MSTEDRLEALERLIASLKRRNRCMVLAGVAIVAGFAALHWSLAEDFKIVSANTFLVKSGSDNDTRGHLWVMGDAGCLDLQDKAGKSNATLAKLTTGWILSLDDENGNSRVYLGPASGCERLKSTDTAFCIVIFDRENKVVWKVP